MQASGITLDRLAIHLTLNIGMQHRPAEACQDAEFAHLIVLGLDACVVVLSAHKEDKSLVVVLDGSDIVERLCSVPILTLLPAILQ